MFAVAGLSTWSPVQTQPRPHQTVIKLWQLFQISKQRQWPRRMTRVTRTWRGSSSPSTRSLTRRWSARAGCGRCARRPRTQVTYPHCARRDLSTNIVQYSTEQNSTVHGPTQHNLDCMSDSLQRREISVMSHSVSCLGSERETCHLFSAVIFDIP